MEGLKELRRGVRASLGGPPLLNSLGVPSEPNSLGSIGFHILGLGTGPGPLEHHHQEFVVGDGIAHGKGRQGDT